MENMHTNFTVEKVKVLSLALTELKLILIQGSFKCWPISFSILNQYSLNNIFIYSHHCLAYLTVRRNFFVSLLWVKVKSFLEMLKELHFTHFTSQNVPAAIFLKFAQYPLINPLIPRSD